MKNTCRSINTFIFLLFVALLSTMAANANDSASFRLLTYFSEIILILYSCYYSIIKNHHSLLNNSIVFVGLILLFNYLLSPNNPNYSDLLKIFGYFCCFSYGTILASMNSNLYANKYLILFLILIPVVFVGLFDGTEKKMTFFANSNVFVYLGVAMALLFTVLYGEKKTLLYAAWGILILYLFVGTSLGIIAAVCMSVFLLNFKLKHLLPLVIGVTCLVLAIFFIDIPVFVRIRDVIALWNTLDNNDLANISDLNLYELSLRADIQGERSDTTSAIWRLTQWLDILTDYIKSIWNIPFGLGAGFAVKKTGLPPHNDYILLLTEYGVFVFTYFILFIKNVYKNLKDHPAIYFILSMYLYHLTENLVFMFPANAMLYFSLGYLLYQKKSINTMLKLKRLITVLQRKF